MKIIVLIVSYRRPDLLRNCLQALERQTRLPDQVIVAGVEGDQATETAVRHFARSSTYPCLWLASPTPSVVLQTNLGLQHCDCDVVVFTNDDAEPFPDWLARIEPYYDDATVGGVGGRDFVHVADGHIFDGETDCVGRITWFGRVYGRHHLNYPHIVDVDILKGVNFSCRRELLGPLDTRMAGGGRWHWELDAAFQVRRSGKRLVFDPKICVDHFHGARSAALEPDFVYMASHNLTLNLAKNFCSWRRLAFLIYDFSWGSYPEMGLAVFVKTYARRLLQHRDWRFSSLLNVSLRGKIDALRALSGEAYR